MKKELTEEQKRKQREYWKEYWENHKDERKKIEERYRKNHRDKLREDYKIYNKKNKDKRKEWRKNHKDRGKEADKKYREIHKDKRKEIDKKYAKSHPEMIRKKCRNRRARKNNIVEAFSDKEWLQKLKNTFGVCPNCNKYVGIHKLTLDHIHPISKAKQGQIYTIDDVQPLCINCNSKKFNNIK